MTAEPAAPTGPPVTAAAHAASAYTARHLSVLEGLEAVRKRPGMYIGSTDSRGLMHCLWEIIDNAVDEALAGHCSRIEVVLHADGSVEVRDNGRGIPVDVEPKTRLTGVELVMTRLHAGGKFGGGSYTASGGLHGVGASVVNALSARLDVRSTARGTSGRPASAAGCPASSPATGPTRRSRRRRACARCAGWPEEGDRHPDPVLARPAGVRARRPVELRRADAAGPADRLPRARARPSTCATSAASEAARGEFRFDGGISEFCEYLAPDEPVTDVLRLRARAVHRDRAGARRPGPHDPDRGGAGADRRRRAALGHRLRQATRSFVNVIATPKGGTHVDRLRAGAGPDAERAAARGPAAEERRRAGHQGRRRSRASPPSSRSGCRAAVRGADQGGARHLGRVPDRGPGGRARAQGVLRRRRKPRRQAAGPRGAGEGGRRGPDPDRRPRAPRQPAPQDRAGDLRAAGQAGRLPQRRRRPQRAVHRRGRLRARHRQAGPQLGVPGAAADPRQDPQRAEGVRWPTC